MIKIIKVTGNSLSPFFLPGDFVLIGNWPIFSRRIAPGDFIVFEHEEYGKLIKKVIDYDPDLEQFIVSGTHPMSLNSNQIGPIPSSAVIGTVILHIRNPLSHSSLD